MDLSVRNISFIQPKLLWDEKPKQADDIFSIAPVQHEFDFLNALRLIYRQYLDQGYCHEDEYGLFYGVHHLSPHAQMLNFKYGHRILATVTKFYDSEIFGLPMDALYKKELDSLRDQGRKLVECGSLASTEEKAFSSAVIYLQRATIYSCIECGMSDMCIAVNPKHVSFYKRFFLFQDLGPERYYKMVSAPAVALRLRLDKLKERLNNGGNIKSNAYTKLSFFQNKLFKSLLNMDNNLLNIPVFQPGNGLIKMLMGLKPDLTKILSKKQRKFFLEKFETS